MGEYVEAAGAIVYRISSEGEDGDEVEVCVVHRPKYGDWSFPKGKLENQESLPHAAVREVQEETGIPVRLTFPLADVTYPLHADGSEGSRDKSRKGGRRSKKTIKTKHVTYWVAQVLSPTDARMRQDALGARIIRDHETDSVQWLSINAAIEKLTYESDKDVLRKFADLSHSGMLETATFIVVRHGKAEARKHWSDSEDLRPLTPTGAAAAFALSRELACFGVKKLVSSPWARCAQTLIPYAAFCRQDIIEAEELNEDTVERSPESTVEFFTSTLADAAKDDAAPVALCTHRPVLKEVLPSLKELCASEEIARQLPDESPYLQTGGALALTLRSGGENGPKIIAVQLLAPVLY